VKTTSIARWTGLVVGVSLALVSLVSARVPPGTGEVPAHVSLVAERSVEIGVTPAGRELLTEHLVVPGRGSVSGLVEVSNFTGGTLELQPRLRAIRGELPDGLHVKLTAGGRTLYDGNVANLHATLRLRARAKQPLRFRFSAPAEAAMSVQGRFADMSLRWAARRAGG
jgi:hypothetical protein